MLATLMAEKMSGISVKIIKNEVGCRDDTVPKTVETRRHCEGLRACNNPLPTSLVFGRLLHALNPPRSAFLFQQSLARCHPYILLRFSLVYMKTTIMQHNVA